MATYKKRGYKPKNKEEEQHLQEMESTTAEVFSSLDEGASKTEEWVAKNQNLILIVIGVVVIGVLGYLAYSNFVSSPKEKEAANELFYAQQYITQAQGLTEKDSLLNLALNGSEGKYGLLDIMQEYNGTDAANIASYSAGMVYLNLNKYEEAIQYLEKFSTDDEILGALALGGMGDAFSQLNQKEQALEYYEKAAKYNDNGFNVPKFLLKAGMAAMDLGQNDKAQEYFQRIKDEFASSSEANSVDVFLGKVSAGK
ncbi:MAG: tetratricopeptide repeat protein [Flavobacteriaceae bacterium]|nr:tetratricopeptide repeat protein [Flavobacteriaceae bacterium]